MAGQGVFAVDRGVFDHAMFAPEPYTEREAWLWMLGAAAWKDCRVRTGRKMVSLLRGQLAFSERFLAEKWQWAKSSVRRFINRLKSEAMVNTLADHDTTIITICNYERYAFDGNQKGPKTGPQSGPPADHSRTKEEEINNSKSKKEDSEAIASGAEAPIDHRKRLFDEGLPKLARLTGKGPDACRSFVGKCLKAASDDAMVVLGLIEDAERNRVADPSSWIVARLKNATGPPGRPLTEHQRKHAEGKGILDDIGEFISSGSGQANPRLLRHDSGDGPESIRGGAGGNLVELSAGRAGKGH